MPGADDELGRPRLAGRLDKARCGVGCLDLEQAPVEGFEQTTVLLEPEGGSTVEVVISSDMDALQPRLARLRRRSLRSG